MYLKLRFYLFIPGRQYFVVVRDGCCYVFDNDQSTQPKVAFSLENYCRYENMFCLYCSYLVFFVLYNKNVVLNLKKSQIHPVKLFKKS